MFIDAPGFSTNSLSSGSILDGERRQHFSEGEKKVDVCFSINFKIFLVSFYAASRTHRSCLSETDPQILERSGCADEVHLGKIILNDGFWSLLLAWRNTALVSRTYLVSTEQTDIISSLFFTIQVWIKLLEIIVLTIHTDSVQEEQLDLPYWIVISVTCVLEDVSIRLDILTSEFSAILEHLPVLSGYMQILHEMLVLHTL